MSTTTEYRSDHALAAYEALAEGYDVLTAGYSYERWLEQIEAMALERGVRGRAVLDVACGSGHSFLPLLRRGWEVTACDLSPAMVRLAAEAAGEAASVFVADMRSLGAIGAFDLVTCLDDAVNYLLEEDELVDAFAGMRRNLAPGGVAVWDVNTLGAQRAAFASDFVRDGGETVVIWHGQTEDEPGPGGVVQAAIDVFVQDGDRWRRSRGVHRQRHWTLSAVTDLAGEVGLRMLAVYGQSRGAKLIEPPDEERDGKLLFVACRDDEA